jgi:hypothetical protein
MTNSPAKEIQDPMVGKAGTDAGAPKQQTGTEQRPGMSLISSPRKRKRNGADGKTLLVPRVNLEPRLLEARTRSLTLPSR